MIHEHEGSEVIDNTVELSDTVDPDRVYLSHPRGGMPGGMAGRRRAR